MSKRLTATLEVGASTSRELGSSVERRFVRYKWSALALTIAGGLVLSWRALHPTLSDAATESAPTAQAERPRAESVTTYESSPVKQSEGSAAISVNQLPSVAPAVTTVSSATSARPLTENKGDQASSTELDIIQRAQTALTSDPSRALAITNEHARAYASGEFVQEREVIAVEALVKMGEREEASRRALALAHRFPNTPYATRLEKAVGRPLVRRPSNPERSTATP
jgi:hypothetical protein